MVYAALKRIMDIAGALTLLAALSPLLLGVAVALKVSPEHRALFRQRRAGRNGQPFIIYKFCTMRADTPPELPFRELTDADRRITPIGRWLRRTSIDELPQLWNVLKGDMSLIGPRPVVYRETALLRERARLGADACRPGLTGLAQVKGRATLSWREKAWYDAVYCRYVGWRLDGWILLQTARCLLRPEYEAAPRKSLDKIGRGSYTD
ncbi:MAG: sugar transferase [Clostridia bacterium]|nr:sugar transferase [Clostridia bacterium]